MTTLIQSALVCLPGDQFQAVDVLIEDGIIKEISSSISPIEDSWEVIDAKQKVLTPAFVDPHVHLREPGYTYKEDFITGTRAALKGGFSAVCAMPNTKPAPDTTVTLRSMMQSAKDKGHVPCYFFSPLSMQLEGEELVDFKALHDSGVLGFSDDGKGLQNAGLMKEAMKCVTAFDGIITAHCEEESLLDGGYIHLGEYAREHDHRGISASSESVQVARDVLLALETGVRYHVCHISTRESLDMVLYGKMRQGQITCEVTPHHLLLCDEDLQEDGNYKMNPPLRSKSDMLYLRQAIKEGKIDCIATDHAPHAQNEKDKGLAKSSFGIIGLETAFPLLYTKLILTGELGLYELLQLMSVKPAEIFRIPHGELRPGGRADLALLDLHRSFVVNREFLESKSSNTPFLGWKLKGFVDSVWIQGQCKLKGGSIIA